MSTRYVDEKISRNKILLQQNRTSLLLEQEALLSNLEGVTPTDGRYIRRADRLQRIDRTLAEINVCLERIGLGNHVVVMSDEEQATFDEHYSLSKEELIAGCERRIKGILEASIQIDELARKNGFCGKWQDDLTDIQTKKRHYYQDAIRKLKGRE